MSSEFSPLRVGVAELLKRKKVHQLLDDLAAIYSCAGGEIVAELRRRFDALQEANFRQACTIMGVDVPAPAGETKGGGG